MAHPTIKKTEKRSTTASSSKSKVEKPTMRMRTRPGARRIDKIIRRNETTPLLRLPRELRDMIYEYVIGGNEITTVHPYLDDPNFIIQAGAYNKNSATEAKWDALYDLSYVCRQLRDETRLLPFKLNVFQVALGTESSDFLQEHKTEFKEAIETVSFGFENYHDSLPAFLFKYTVPKELEDCKNLKRVIARRILHPIQILLIKLFAIKISLNYIEEKNCLPYVRTEVVGGDDSMYEDGFDSQYD